MTRHYDKLLTNAKTVADYDSFLRTADGHKLYEGLLKTGMTQEDIARDICFAQNERAVLDDPNMKRILFDVRQAAVFADTDTPDLGAVGRLRTPFDRFYLELSQPLNVLPHLPQRATFLVGLAYRKLNFGQPTFAELTPRGRRALDNGINDFLPPPMLKSDGPDPCVGLWMLFYTDPHGYFARHLYADLASDAYYLTARSATIAMDVTSPESPTADRWSDNVAVTREDFVAPLPHAARNFIGALGGDSYRVSELPPGLSPSGGFVGFLHTPDKVTVMPADLVGPIPTDAETVSYEYGPQTNRRKWNGVVVECPNRQIGTHENRLQREVSLIQWLCLYLMCRGVRLREVSGLTRQQKRWHERTETPLPPPWHMVELETRGSRPGVPGNTVTERSTRYRFDVIGHLRFNKHHTKEGLKETIEWVPAHQRGLQNSLYVPKTTKVRSSNTPVAQPIKDYFGTDVPQPDKEGK